MDYYRAVAGEHEDWDDYRRAMQAEQRCLLRITLLRAGPDRAGRRGEDARRARTTCLPAPHARGGWVRPDEHRPAGPRLSPR